VFPDLQHIHTSHDLKAQYFPHFNTYKRRDTGLSVSPFTTHTQATISRLSISPISKHTKDVSQGCVPPLQHIHKPQSQGSVFPLYKTYTSHDLKSQCFPRFNTYKRRDTGLSVSPFTTHTKDVNQGSDLSHFNAHKTRNQGSVLPLICVTLQKKQLFLYSVLNLFKAKINLRKSPKLPQIKHAVPALLKLTG